MFALRYAAAHSCFATGPPVPAAMNEHVPGRRRCLRGASPRRRRRACTAAPPAEKKREPLVVGGLPVTCNLTLPVACVAKDATLKARTAGRRFRLPRTTSTRAGRRSRNR